MHRNQHLPDTFAISTFTQNDKNRSRLRKSSTILRLSHTKPFRCHKTAKILFSADLQCKVKNANRISQISLRIKLVNYFQRATNSSPIQYSCSSFRDDESPRLHVARVKVRKFSARIFRQESRSFPRNELNRKIEPNIVQHNSVLVPTRHQTRFPFDTIRYGKKRKREKRR